MRRKLPRRSLTRTCEHPGCGADRLPETMTRLESGAWYCPTHALLLAARDLVGLYRAEGDADWTAIAEIIGQVLPGVVAKFDAHDA